MNVPRQKISWRAWLNWEIVAILSWKKTAPMVSSALGHRQLLHSSAPTNPTDDLNAFEKLLINRVFGSAMTKELEDLKHKFYRSIPKLQSALYDELVERDYFPRSPEATRNLYRGWGMALLFIPFIGLFFLPEDGSFNISESMGIVLPMVAIIINGLFLLIMSNFMPAKTIEGARQAALWRAFRNYLAAYSEI
jgi:hypothetical protein